MRTKFLTMALAVTVMLTGINAKSARGEERRDPPITVHDERWEMVKKIQKEKKEKEEKEEKEKKIKKHERKTGREVKSWQILNR